MLSNTLARRARRGIILRLFLKLGALTAALMLAVLCAFFPSSGLVQGLKDGVSQAGNLARSWTGRDGANSATRSSTDLDRLRGVNGFAASEIRCLALAIYYEAGREAREAQIGVAQVALNRAAAAKTPKLLCKVVYNGVGTPGACLYDATCRNVGVTPRQDAVLADATALAFDIAAGNVSAPQFAKATHFHETKNPPPWARGLFTLTTIGKLRFAVTDQPENTADPAPDPNAAAPERQSRGNAGSAGAAGSSGSAARRPTSSGSAPATSAPRDTRELSRQVFGID